ncbi:MAG: FkbM family methyltransferase [Acidimicrobiia bacterium]|nr:FkbM family methyltransferase [Acidimicrobiia bacterium]
MTRTRGPGQSVLASSVDFVGKRLAPRVPAQSRLRPPLARIRRRLLPPADPLWRLVEEFARASIQPFFLQIGANDGAKGDYLDTYLRSCDWTGILVEPIPYVFEALQQRHGSNTRLTLVNAAIADHDGTAQLYYLPKADDPDLPSWYDALATFRREVIAAHAPWIPDIESRISTIEVPTFTVDSLCETHDIRTIDLVQMDTEGYDYDVVKQIDLDHYRPAIVLYEHYHLRPGEREACERHLEDHGYRSISNFFDTLAVRIDAADRRARRLNRLLTKLRADHPPAPLTRHLGALANRPLRRFGVELVRVRVSAAGRATARPPDLRDLPFDLRFHATEESLPAGAAEYLQSTNPRLRELRDSYARLDWPATRHSRWRDEDVAGWLNLKYFRGDNIIVWHYRDEASVGAAPTSARDGVRHNRLFYFTYLRYVLDQPDGGHLVELLGEDGGFGCWVYEFAGYPACSRDLLDSVNELLFLDKHLSVKSRSGLRVLDIGAGYGRLAHRASQALSGLRDYCCVDAIAESTFLCEYYMRFRNVVPPVRVAALPDVPSLLRNEFDLAINVHSFSECTLEAVQWWMSEVARLCVPYVFIVPNEREGFLTTEGDGSQRDYLPVLESNGYRLVVDAHAVQDEAVRTVLGIDDRFCLFERN